MRIVFCISLFFFIVFGAFGASLESEFVIDSKAQELKEGDTFNATLRLWPVEELDSSELKKLLHTKLFDSFYMAEIESIAPSPNNADVAELKALFIVVGKVNPNKLTINYHDEMVHVRFKEVLIRELPNKSNDFLIENQSTDQTYLIWIFIILVVSLVITWLIYKKKFFTSRIKLPREKQTFVKSFINAKTREDYEKIYSEKDKWLKLLEEVTPAHNEFFNVLNEHQYKKDWTPNIKQEVDESFEQIRRSFK